MPAYPDFQIEQTNHLRPGEAGWQMTMESLFQLNRAVLLHVDRHGRIVQAQGAVLDLLGAAPVDLKGRWLRSFIPLPLRNAWVNHYRAQILSRQSTHRSRWYLEQPDGRLTPVEQTVTLQIDNGVVIGAGFWITTVPEQEDVPPPLQKPLTAPDPNTTSGNTVQNFMDHLPLMVFILHGSEVIYVNPAVAHLTGYTLDDLRNHFASDLLEADGWTNVFERIVRCLESGQPEIFEQLFQRKDGTSAWAAVTLTRLKAAKGHDLIAGTATDITARKQIEQALTYSEARQRVLIDNIHDALASLDKDLRLITMNATFRQRIMALYNMEPQIGELLTLPLGNIEVAEAWMKRLHRVLKGERVQFEERLEANGIVIDTDVTLTPIFGGDGTVEGLAINSRDVTERKRIAAAQIEYTRRLEILQELDTELSQLRQMDAVLETAIDAAVRLTGASAGAIHLLEGDMLRLSRDIGVFPTPAQPILCGLDQGIIGRVARRLEAEMVLNVQKDPDYIPNVTSTRAQITVPLIAREGLIGILNVQTEDPRRFTDQTFKFVRLFAGRVAAAIDNARLYESQEKQVQELQKLYDQVSNLEQLKTQMIRITAHDLRNPLGTISGYVELLDMELREQLSSRHQEFLGVLAESADRIDRISRNILALERANSARNGLVAEAVDLMGIARQVAADYQPQAARQRKTFNLEVPPGHLLMQIDRVLIQEAISNLVGNAFKYTPEGGNIRLSLHPEPEQVVIEVNDTGYGIPADQQAGLFQPFYRVKTEQTRQIKGSGLGLSLVKSIAERHGGRVEFNSAPGMGSSFRMVLPGPLLTNPDPAGIETLPAEQPRRKPRRARPSANRNKSKTS
jgi:PAS domain S-box-containing protein